MITGQYEIFAIGAMEIELFDIARIEEKKLKILLDLSVQLAVALIYKQITGLFKMA